jgi:hypothetical protein
MSDDYIYSEAFIEQTYAALKDRLKTNPDAAREMTRSNRYHLQARYRNTVELLLKRLEQEQQA